MLDSTVVAMGDDRWTTALELVIASPFGTGFAAVWGALWGSFFNVAIHRVPLEQSVVRPASRCPKCARPIRALENVPILSWLALRGRCAGCREPISVRYPIVEALSLALATWLWLRLLAHGGEPVHLVARFFFGFALVGVLLVLSGIDLDHMLIPDRITYPAIPIFLGAALLLGDVPRWDLVLGPFVGYGLVAITAEVGRFILKRDAMGYGDAKLMALVGAALGWRAAVFVFFAAPFAGLAILGPMLAVRGKGVRGVEVPYGPFLAAAAVGYLLYERELRELFAALVPW